MEPLSFLTSRLTRPLHTIPPRGVWPERVSPPDPHSLLLAACCCRNISSERGCRCGTHRRRFFVPRQTGSQSRRAGNRQFQTDCSSCTTKPVPAQHGHPHLARLPMTYAALMRLRRIRGEPASHFQRGASTMSRNARWRQLLMDEPVGYAKPRANPQTVQHRHRHLSAIRAHLRHTAAQNSRRVERIQNGRACCGYDARSKPSPAEHGSWGSLFWGSY